VLYGYVNKLFAIIYGLLHTCFRCLKSEVDDVYHQTDLLAIRIEWLEKIIL